MPKGLVLWNPVNVPPRSQNFEKRLLASSSLSARPSVRPTGTTRLPQGGFQWNMKLLYSSIHKNLTWVTGTLHDDLCTFITRFCPIIVRMRNVWEACCTSNQNTRFMFNNNPPLPPKNCAIYEIMWKNMVKPDGRQATIRRVRTAWWITKATYTLRIRNSYCLSTAIKVTRTRINVTLNVNCLSC